MAEQGHRDTLTTVTSHQARAQLSPQAPAQVQARVQSPIVDSLRTDSVTTTTIDYSQAYPYPVYGTADSLRVQYNIGNSVYQNVPAEAVFSTTSVTVRSPLPHTEAPKLTDNSVFQGFVLLLAALYAMLLYANANDIHTLFGRVLHDPRKRVFEESGNNFTRFLYLISFIGMLFVGLFVVKYGDSLMPLALHNLWPNGTVIALSLLASLVGISWMIYQQLLLRLAGAVLLIQPFISQLILLKHTYFSLGTILIAPTLLLFVFCPPNTGAVWSIILIVEVILVIIIYLAATLNLFLSKKISILHWFLYLCTVEVFPISLLGLLAIR